MASLPIQLVATDNVATLVELCAKFRDLDNKIQHLSENREPTRYYFGVDFADGQDQTVYMNGPCSTCGRQLVKDDNEKLFCSGCRKIPTECKCTPL